jgi:hypothetical protein
MDTGISGTVDRIDAVDTGTRQLLTRLSQKVDTGVPLSVWASTTRSLTAFVHDTGVADTVWKASLSTYTDTGSAGYKLDLVDTGIRSAIAAVDTGTTINLNRILAKIDTGVDVTVDLTPVTAKLDTGVPASVRVAMDSGTINAGVAVASMGPNVVNDFAFAADAATKIAARVKVMHDSGTWQDTGLEESVLRLSAKLDTGVPASVWAESGSSFTDTGSLGYKLDLADTGVKGHIDSLSTKVDTGVPLSVWAAAARTLTAWAFDTGVQQKLDRLDTGVHSDLHRIIAKIDTGVGVTVDLTPVTAKLDSGVPASVRVAMDSGTINAGVAVASMGANVVNDFAFAADAATKIAARVKVMHDSGTWQDTGLEESVARLSAKLDTGVPASVKALADTGIHPVNIEQIDSFANAAVDLRQFVLKLSDSGTMDTGTFPFIKKLDTGNAADHALTRTSLAAVDTGIQGELDRIKAKIDTGVTASVNIDTGQINQAVWQGDATRTLTAMDYDTGIRQALARHDTGVHSDLHRLIAKVDTGVSFTPDLTPVLNKLDTGVVDSIVNPISDQLDTGVPSDVWAFSAESGRTLTAFAFPVDTGPLQAIARLDTGINETIDRIFTQTDTGGVAANLTPVTAKLDTGVVSANIVQVNSTAVQGTGDTGTNDPWRPA